MSQPVSYAEAGVNRELRARSKAALKALEQTYRFSNYGAVLQLPFGKVFPLGDRYLDLAIEGVGTKVLLAQLAEKYDTIGIDGVAMSVNDVIRSGAKPLAIVDNIHAQISDPLLVKEWMKGLVEGAVASRCIVPGGEIGDVAEIIRGISEGKGFDLVVACIGEIDKQHVIFGDDIQAGDVVIGLRSSGIHSNGVTLARKILFKRWGGKFDPYDVPEGLDRELIYEILEPTRIYARPLQEVMQTHRIKGAVHITGDAYLKFNKLMEFSKGIGFEFHNFKAQGIFELIQATAQAYGGISDEEMLKTFNMGWGFAIIVDKTEQDDVLTILAKNQAEVIGTVQSLNRITAVYNGKRLALW